jgi:hypothetical protein
MTRWQKVEWDDEGNVIAPEFAVRRGATWPLLARFEQPVNPRGADYLAGGFTMIDLNRVQQDIADFFARGGQIEHVPRGVTKRAMDESGDWQADHNKGGFAISKDRDRYRPMVNDDGEPVV